MSRDFRDPFDSFPLRAQSLRAGYGNQISFPTNSSPPSDGEGTTSVVPIRSPVMTALAAGDRCGPKECTPGAKAPISLALFGTSKLVPSPLVPTERIQTVPNNLHANPRFVLSLNLTRGSRIRDAVATRVSHLQQSH